MAIDPNIILQGRLANIDVQRSFNNALMNVQAVRGLQEAETQAPLRNRLLEAQTQQAETEAGRAARESKFQSIVFGAQELLPALKSGNIDAAMNTLLARKTDLVAKGMPTQETDRAIQTLQNDPQALLAQVQEVIEVGTSQGIIKAPGVGTASQRDFAQFQALTQKAEQTGAAADIQAAQQFGIQSGFSRPTAQELSAIEVAETGAKAQVKADIELSTVGKIAGTKAAAKASIVRSEKAFDQIAKIRINVNNLDEVIRLIDEGASTGVIASKLPSVRASSVALDNLQGRLGLDVIGETTFGALSESELAFALNTALPKNLSGPDLKRWVQRKKDAQLKLSGYLEEVAQFLGTPGNTTADFIELQKLKQIDEEQGAIQVEPSTVGRFQIEVVQ